MGNEQWATSHYRTVSNLQKEEGEGEGTRWHTHEGIPMCAHVGTVQGHTRGRAWAGVNKTASCPHSTQPHLHNYAHSYLEVYIHTHLYTYTFILCTQQCTLTKKVMGRLPLEQCHTLYCMQCTRAYMNSCRAWPIRDPFIARGKRICCQYSWGDWEIKKAYVCSPAAWSYNIRMTNLKNSFQDIFIVFIY